jgi:hypothetical protein
MEIRLRYIRRNYRPFKGMRLLVDIPAASLRPLHELPNIDDEVIATTTARLGTTIFPERDDQIARTTQKSNTSSLSILTPYNDLVPGTVFDALQQQAEDTRCKKQMTFALFANWIDLRPKEAFIAYIPAIIRRLRLASLYEKSELWCMPCSCGNVLFSSSSSPARCDACDSEEEVMLQLNPQILSLCDETGGSGDESEHQVLVTETAWKKLLRCPPETLASSPGGPPELERVLQQKLEEFESQLVFQRSVFVIGWSGKWSGGRVVVLDVLPSL